MLLTELAQLVARDWEVLPRHPARHNFELKCRGCGYRLTVSPMDDVRTIDFQCPTCRETRDAEAAWREHFGILAELWA